MLVSLRPTKVIGVFAFYVKLMIYVSPAAIGPTCAEISEHQAATAIDSAISMS